MASNDDIMRVLGRIEEKVEQLEKAFKTEKQDAHDSRATIHRRLDEQVSQIALLDKTVEIAGMIDAQMRDRMEGLATTVADNHNAVAPSIEEWKRLKFLGYGVSGLIAMAGISVAGLVLWAGEAAVTTIRHWLKIP